MNSQLTLHLETFDSDEEFSESPELHEEEHVAPVFHDLINPVDFALLKSKAYVRKFVKPKSLKEAIVKVVWLLPIGIALGDYIGLLLSMNLALICLVLMQLKPEPPHKETQQQPLKEVIDTKEQVRNGLAERKKQVHDCRKEVSRLLGLVGAPPLEWKDLEIGTQQIDAAGLTDIATISVVKFLEAHAQFLLTVDEAYHWVKISASLHLGLGPQSQCVERVERASIAREFRNRRRHSIGASLILEGVGSAPEPQRGFGKSVLSLSSVRNHLARAMIDQSDSLIQVWKSVRVAAGTAGNPGVFPHIDILYMPEVVDLTWIKAARQQLAALLSHLVDHFCTLDVLLTLSQQLGARSKLDESMWNARNAREHLLCNLLLGKKRIVTPLEPSSYKLMLSLLQYREQLDALSGAIWACQQYIDELPTENEKEAARISWWSQVTQLGAICRALETEISSNFFPNREKDEEVNNREVITESDECQIRNESGYYEHGDDGRSSPAEKTRGDSRPHKTVVFKGKGVREDRRKTTGEPTKVKTIGEPQSVLPRDTVSEQILVKELQNRITAFRIPDEDESESETEDEKAAKAAAAPTISHFLGASGSLLSELKLSIRAIEGSRERIIGGH